LANSLLNQGKLAEVVELLEANRSGGSAPAPNLILLGQAYLQRQQAEEARACFLEALQAAPEDANGYFGLATACARLGQKEQAARYREEFRNLQARQLRDGIEQGRDYDDLRSTSGELAETWVAAASLYASQGEQKVAEQAVRRALRLDPTNARYQQTLEAIRENQ
jgi:Tfp pilus assembly protein PilF